MATQDPISNLQEVTTWLLSLTVGQQTSISKEMFSAPLVQQAFTLLPGSDPINLTVTVIDTATNTLTGTATLLGEADTTVVFVFTEPASELLLTLTMTPPASLVWKMVPQLEFGFGGLSATLTPNTDVNVIAMSFAATLGTTTQPSLTFPVQLLVPTFDGDWVLSSEDIPLGALTAEALNALAGGQDVLSILPPELADLSKLKLSSFEMAFNFTKQTCSTLRLNIEYDGNWTFFDNRFVIQSVNFDVDVYNPFTPNLAFDAKLYAKMALPPLPAFEVGGQFPDAAVFVQLAPGEVLHISDVMTYFGITVPTGMPDVQVSTLGFTLYPSDGSFRFNLAITQPVLIYQGSGSTNLSLTSFLFDVGVRYVQSGTTETTGGMYAAFLIGGTSIAISGAYSTSAGLDLVGQTTNVPIGALLTDLATTFGIPQSAVPAPIQALTLTSLRAELNTGTSTFDFNCAATTTISGTSCEFIPTIHVNYGSTTPSSKYGGVLILHVPQDGGRTKDLVFTVTYSSTPTDNWIQATFAITGGVVEFADLAAVFGVTLPPIPPALDLALTDLGFRYDFSTKALTFGANSQNYGTAVFVSLPISNVQQYVFLLDANQTFSLSNLPLVGEELAKIENIELSKLGVAISTMSTIDPATADTINKQITGVLGSTYPQLPKLGIKGLILITAQMQIGSDVLPLSVSLGGSNSSPSSNSIPKQLPAGVSAPAQARVGEVVTGGSQSDSVTWFNIQRSFGPVTIGRIGAMYQSETSTLWFEIDASLMFGPLSLELTGLGIGSPLTTFDPQFFLQGLGIAYSAPPLTIAGALINLALPGSTSIEFAGAVMIGTGTFTLQAYGYYGDTQGFPSMFLFGDLKYPIGGLPAFFVTGAAVGFGFNSNITIPAIDQVQIFPFIQVLANPDFFGKNPAPATVLNKMITTGPTKDVMWVFPSDNSLWFSAGITFTSFELVNSVAMIFVDAGPELVIALIGVAISQFPQKIPGVSNEPVYAYVELDLLIRFAPQEGVFSVQAVLASSSFLLDRACVLMGGFAFFVWYSPSPYAGDFVLSLGGYHPGFTPPAYYPKVPRVGFHWSIDSSITISGGAYLAFTPAAMMVGGALNATYQSGNLKAWFNAQADVIVRWNPFWFDAEIGITVGASYTMDLLFTSATFSVELGVDLEIWGPPTGGTVSVDWYIISFSIDFGASKTNSPTITGWNDGVQPMLPNTGKDGTYNVLSIAPTAGLTPNGTQPPASDPMGAATADDDPKVPWIVRGSQFGFSIDSPIPASKIAIGSQAPIQGPTFDVYPLGWKQVSATQTITITNSAKVDFSTAFEITTTVNSVAASLWGTPPETKNGKPQVPSSTDLLVPNQNTGISALVNPPTLGYSPGSVNLTLLAYDNLSLPDAIVPVNTSSGPTGDTAQASTETVSIIANATSGIGSQTSQQTRTAILTALQKTTLAPVTANDPMTAFAAEAGSLFSAQPLLVAQS